MLAVDRENARATETEREPDRMCVCVHRRTQQNRAAMRAHCLLGCPCSAWMSDDEVHAAVGRVIAPNVRGRLLDLVENSQDPTSTRKGLRQ